jgi:hypothetical protein
LHCEQFTLSINGVGSGELELYCDQLNVHLSGAAETKLRGETMKLDVINSGVDKIDAMNLNAAKATVVNSGVGKVSVKATQELSMTNSGIGTITYKGDAKILTMNSNKPGKIKKVK